jgi:hypothetical protein
MSISSIGQTNTTMWQNATQPVHSSSSTTKITSQQNNVDTVDLSNASQEELAKALAAEKGAALPSWLAEHGTPSNIVNLHTDGAMAEGKERIRMSDAAYADGVITKAEQKAMDSYRDTMTETKAWLSQQFFNIEHSQELAEYGKLRIDALSEAKAAFGLDPDSVFLSGVDETNSADIGKKFQEILTSNPRSVELMGILGVKQQS